MKRILVLLAAAAALCACSQEKKVMARFVPERSDDFVFENNLIAGRFYGKALEGPAVFTARRWRVIPLPRDWTSG